MINEPLVEDADSLETVGIRITDANLEFYRKKLLAQSTSESFLAMHDTGKIEKSATLLKKVIKVYPDYENYADLTLLHDLSFLKTVSLFKKMSVSPDLIQQSKRSGQCCWPKTAIIHMQIIIGRLL